MAVGSLQTRIQPSEAMDTRRRQSEENRAPVTCSEWPDTVATHWPVKKSNIRTHLGEGEGEGEGEGGGEGEGEGESHLSKEHTAAYMPAGSKRRECRSHLQDKRQDQRHDTTRQNTRQGKT
jgi:hypothetical protein